MASTKVKDQVDLWFIIYYIYSKITKCGDDRAIYMKSLGVTSLNEICRKSLANFVMQQQDCGKQDSDMTLSNLHLECPDESSLTASDKGNFFCNDTEGYQKLLKEKLATTRVSKQMKRKLESAMPCKTCENACYESCYKLYLINRSRSTEMSPFCSYNCCEKDPSFTERTVFRYA